MQTSLLREDYPGRRSYSGAYHRNERLASLIDRCTGAVLPFRDLPAPAQYALAMYLSLDGEAWQTPEAITNGCQLLHRAQASHGSRDARTLAARGSLLAAFKLSMPWYADRYGAQRFGHLPAVPLPWLIESIMQDNDLREWAADSSPGGSSPGATPGWSEYHHWYMTHAATKHAALDAEPWPVILGDHPSETLQDGWTRFHHYAERGLATVPAVFFPGQASQVSQVSQAEVLTA